MVTDKQVISFKRRIVGISTITHGVSIPRQYILDGQLVPGQEYQVTLEVVKKVRK